MTFHYWRILCISFFRKSEKDSLNGWFGATIFSMYGCHNKEPQKTRTYIGSGEKSFFDFKNICFAVFCLHQIKYHEKKYKFYGKHTNGKQFPRNASKEEKMECLVKRTREATSKMFSKGKFRIAFSLCIIAKKR